MPFFFLRRFEIMRKIFILLFLSFLSSREALTGEETKSAKIPNSFFHWGPRAKIIDLKRGLSGGKFNLNGWELTPNTYVNISLGGALSGHQGLFMWVNPFGATGMNRVDENYAEEGQEVEEFHK